MTKRRWLIIGPLLLLLIGCNPITSITLDNTEVEMNVGDIKTLSATILPRSDESYMWWNSSDNDIVSIEVIPDTDFQWTLTAESLGTAEIFIGETKTGDYATCTVNVVNSVDTRLYNLYLSEGLLIPEFSSDIYEYSTSVSYSCTSLEVFTIPGKTDLITKINGIEDNSTVDLAEGDNSITIKLSDSSGTSESEYSISVTRNSAGTAASLSSVLFSDGILDPAFDTNTYTYTNQVAVNVENISFEFFGTDSNISILANDSILLSSGEIYSGFPLEYGNNILNIFITSEDGVSQKTYIVNIRRSESDEI